MHTIKRVGERVRELRKERTWSQRQLSVKAKVSRLTVINVETGNYGSVKSTTIDKLAKALGVESAELLSVPQTKSS